MYIAYVNFKFLTVADRCAVRSTYRFCRTVDRRSEARHDAFVAACRLSDQRRDERLAR